MNKLFFITALFLLFAAHSFATDNYAGQWQKGNAFYSQKQYDSALNCYEQIAALKPKNAVVYYNLANTYYRLNKVAPAILNYRRALVIDPDYTAAKENMLLAQSRISNTLVPAEDIFFIRWWRATTRPDRANVLAVISLVLFVLLIAVLLVNQVRKAGSKRIPPQVAGIVFFVFICFLSLAAISARNATAHDSGVVMQPDVPLMNNELKGKPLTLIPEGTTVDIKEQKGEWIRVSLPDGHAGWVQVGTVDKI